MNVDGYIAYVSAYESGSTTWDQYFDDDDETFYDPSEDGQSPSNFDTLDFLADTRSDDDLMWMNYQMEFYGILNAMMPQMDDDGEVYIRWALPVAAYNAAGEICIESEGLGPLIHALFKIFIYYPFDREYNMVYTQLVNEHDCKENFDEYSDDTQCDPACRDDCKWGGSGSKVCGTPMLITEASGFAVPHPNSDLFPTCTRDCNVMTEYEDSDGERVPDTWQFWECQYNEVPYLREYEDVWGGDDWGSWTAYEEDMEELEWFTDFTQTLLTPLVKPIMTTWGEVSAEYNLYDPEVEIRDKIVPYTRWAYD